MKECNVVISENGRVVIPFLFRKELNLKPGDELIVSLSEDNDIIIHSPKQSLRKLQNLVTSKNKKDLVKEVIKMRRNEEI